MADQEKVADKTYVVQDPNTGVNRQIIAGQKIPPDLVDAKPGPSVVDHDNDEAFDGKPDSKAAAGKGKDGKDSE